MDQVYDVLIVGGGSAATSAAMTLRNRGKSIAVVTNKPETSSLYKAEKITNYPGLPPMTGAEMTTVVLSIPSRAPRTCTGASGAKLIASPKTGHIEKLL